MAEIDAGALPVGENDRLVGMITDRDIAIRAVAAGQSPDAKIRGVMSKEVLYCFDDEANDDVARNMSDAKVRRLPVVDRDKRLVGILSLGDLALNEDAKTARVKPSPTSRNRAERIRRPATEARQGGRTAGFPAP